MAFTHKRIDLTFILNVFEDAPSTGEKLFGDTGTDTLKITGLRVSLMLENAGYFQNGGLQLRVYGMTLEHMNQLSSIGHYPYGTTNNVVRVEVGDDQEGVALLYQGRIVAAWSDFADMPNVVFYVLGAPDMLLAMVPIPPTSFKGLADVAAIMSGLALAAGLGFVNKGVTSKVSDPYLPGTATDQIHELADAAHIETDIDDGAKTLTIWPRGGSRGGDIPLIAPGKGLVGYPTYVATGILIIIEYNPSIKFGSQIKLESSIKPACGLWYVSKITHLLESELPNGSWFSRIEAQATAIAPEQPSDSQPTPPGQVTIESIIVTP